MPEYEVNFSAFGHVTVDAEDEEEARSKASSEVVDGAGISVSIDGVETERADKR